MNEQAEQAKTADDIFADKYEEQVMGAILHGNNITISTEIDFGRQKMPVELNMRWPNVGDHQEIGRITTMLLGGMEPRLALARDLNLARARALIEVLGEAPFPSWLPPHEQPVLVTSIDGRTRQQMRPNTAMCKVPNALVELYYEADQVIQRFQYMGC